MDLGFRVFHSGNPKSHRLYVWNDEVEDSILRALRLRRSGRIVSELHLRRLFPGHAGRLDAGFDWTARADHGCGWKFFLYPESDSKWRARNRKSDSDRDGNQRNPGVVPVHVPAHDISKRDERRRGDQCARIREPRECAHPQLRRSRNVAHQVSYARNEWTYDEHPA